MTSSSFVQKKLLEPWPLRSGFSLPRSQAVKGKGSTIVARFSALPLEDRNLLAKIQDTDFGSVELAIRDGKPDLTRPMRVTRTVKLDSKGHPSRKLLAQDYDLKVQHKNLLHEISQIKDPKTVRIDIQNGLPIRMKVEDTTAQ